MEYLPLKICAKRGNWERFRSRRRNERFLAAQSKIYKRDKFTCVRCGKPCNEVHHIFSQSHSPHLKYDPENAVCSCYDCHEAISKDGRKRFT